MYLLVIKQLGIMCLIVLAGFVFAKVTKVGDKEQKFLSKLLLMFINPCLIVSQFFSEEFSVEKLRSFGFTMAVSAVVMAITIFVSIAFTYTKKSGKSPAQIDREKGYNHLDRLATVFTNCGFIGIPLISGVFPKEQYGSLPVFYLLGFLVVFNILLWTFGSLQMSGTVNLKKIVTNPNIIVVVFGLVIFCIPYKLPETAREVIEKPISIIGGLNTGVAMILIGIMFANFHFEKEYVGRIIKLTLVRLVVCSIVILGVVFGLYRIFGNVIPECRLILLVVYICSLCPSATSVPSMACLFDRDAIYGSLLVSVTTIFCVVTLPVFVALAEKVMPLAA